MAGRPVHDHDTPCCVFLGRKADYDLYWCTDHGFLTRGRGVLFVGLHSLDLEPFATAYRYAQIKGYV